VYSKIQLITLTTLVILSVLGGVLGHYYDSDMGFVIGILSTYFGFAALLIVTGKVKLKR